MMLTCTKCNETKDIELFVKSSRNKIGYTTRCKECQNEYQRNWNKKNPEYEKNRYQNRKEAMSKYGKIRYQDNKEEIKASVREWRLDNIDAVREYDRNYYKNNKERISEYNRQHYLQNKDDYIKRAKIHNHKRRDILLGLEDDFSKNDLEELLTYFNYSCAICGSDYEHLDHFIPIIVGKVGTVVGNMIPMCAYHNLSKNSNNPFDWANDLSTEEYSNFIKVVKYLSIKNDMSFNNYKDYVNNSFNDSNNENKGE